MSEFRGDFDKLGLLQANLARLASVPSRVAADVSVGLRDAIEEEFEAGKDPYGSAWAALADSTRQRGRTPPPLTDTGATIDSLEVRPQSGAGIQISFGTEYIGYHQTGTENMPARPPLPAAGFPSTWSKIIGASASKNFTSTMGGR